MVELNLATFINTKKTTKNPSQLSHPHGEQGATDYAETHQLYMSLHYTAKGRFFWLIQQQTDEYHSNMHIDSDPVYTAW